MPYLLKHREQLSSLTKLCTVHIPYICYCRNVYYLWEFTGLQTPMKLKQPWQYSPSGMLQCWDIFIPHPDHLTISSKICIQHIFKMARLSSIVKTIPVRTSIKPWIFSVYRVWTTNDTASFLKTDQYPKLGGRGKEGVQAKGKWCSQIHQEAILREQSLTHKKRMDGFASQYSWMDGLASFKRVGSKLMVLTRGKYNKRGLDSGISFSFLYPSFSPI